MEKDIFQKWVEEVNKIRDEASQKLAELHNRLSELEAQSRASVSESEVFKLLASARGIAAELRSLKHSVKSRARELLVEALQLKQAGKSELYADVREYIEDIVDNIEDSIEDLEDRVDDVVDELKEALRGGARREVRVITAEPSEGFKMLKVDLSALERALKEMDKAIREALSGAWLKTPSTIVSSVRLPQADLSVIDLLVEAGVFKSRNEGIAFFVHKGIEASKDWLERVRGRIEEIKKLQEETRRELESLMGSTERGEQPKQ